MKFLQICNKIPFPVIDGGAAAMNQIGIGLSNLGHKVKIIAINTHKQEFSEKSLDKNYIDRFNPEYVFLDTRIKSLDALKNLFTVSSYNIERFDDPSMREKIKSVLIREVFDVIILDSLYVTPYVSTIRKYSKAKIVLRAHNIEHKIWERKYLQESNPIKKSYLKLLASRLKKYEQKSVSEVDGVAAISIEDVKYFKKNFSLPIEFIPFGFDERPVPKFESFNNTKAYFLGAMDWHPNIQAVSWMIENIFPSIDSETRDFSITIAGNKMPSEFLNYKSNNLIVKGKIDDPISFSDDFGIMLAPILSGGGLKIKVVEAMALGKTVITTDVGAEGLGAIPGKHFYLCNSKEEFISAIKSCIAEKQRAYEMALQGQQFIMDNFNVVSIMKRLEGFVKSMI
ncbi:MAG: glycosyltransferase family 4 protein [Bacteroidota bacterium]